MSQGKSETVEIGSAELPSAGCLNAHKKAYRVKDVSAFAAEVGIGCPILLTQGAWESCVIVPDDCPMQDPYERLWNVLAAMDHACMSYQGGSVIPFAVSVSNGGGELKSVQLKVVCESEPVTGEFVLLIMLPNE